MLEFGNSSNDCSCNNNNLENFSSSCNDELRVITWNSITGKPSCFNPCDHKHPASDITGLAAFINNTVFATDISNTNSIYLEKSSKILTATLKISAETTTDYKIPLEIKTDGLFGKIPYASGSTSGILNTTDWNIFNNKFNTPSGTTSQYIRGDGSLAVFPLVVTSSRSINTASPLTGGGDLTANRTISMPSANSTTNGYLLYTDWIIFNNKFTLPSLTNGSVLFSNGTTIVQNNANFFWDNTNNRLGLGTNSPLYNLHVYNGSSIVSSIFEGSFGTYLGLKSSSQTVTLKLLNANAVLSSTNLLNFSPNGLDISLGQYAARFESNNIFSFKYGIAIDGTTYYNAVGGTSTSIANNSYGVTIGPLTGATVSIALPTNPADGQEVCVTVETNKTITLTSTKTIYGHNGGLNITINLTNDAASIIAKYFPLGNSGAGAWYITGL